MIEGGDLTEVANVLGLAVPESGYSSLSFSEEISRGLPLQCIAQVQELVAPESPSFVWRVISKQTLARRRKLGQPLSQVESERLARITRVWTLAHDVYKDKGMARSFLNRAHPMLEGRVPLELATETEYGAYAVIEVLGRLKYGSAA